MQVKILYIGRDAEITIVMNRLLNARSEWKGYCVCTDADAVSICGLETFHLVLLGNGIDQEAEILLRKQLLAIQPDLKIIQHYGGGSGLLYGEIMTAINQF